MCGPPNEDQVGLAETCTAEEGVYQGPLKLNGWLAGGDAYKYGFAAMVLILNMAGGKENEYVSESSQVT